VPKQRRFRFGVASSFIEPAEKWREFARKAEDLGFDVLLMADHMSRQMSPLLACLSAADATTRLRVGTQVIANDFRNPAVFAKEVATLDLLSGGRFELGIGVGWPATSNTGRSDYAQTGLQMDEPGPRVTRLGETLRILKTFLSSEEPFDFEGKHFNLKGLNPFPHPIQKPRTPIMVAGAGPRILRLAAREADIINIAPRPPTVGLTAVGSRAFGLTMADEVGIIKEAAGDRYGDVEICVFSNNPTNPYIGDDTGPALERLAADLQTTTDVVKEMPATMIGSVDYLVDRLQQHRDQYNISYRIVSAAAMDAFAPIVKRLSGS
jgi:probable F420-dependent oxidoreductase